MRSDGVGPKCNDPHLIRRPLTTGRSQLRDVGGRDWREAAVSPGTPQVAGSAGRKGPPLEASEGVAPRTPLSQASGPRAAGAAFLWL